MTKKSFHFQGVLFYPLSILYGIIVWVRNVLFDSGILKSTEFQIPVISVGNITVGGTGKTPHTEYLIKLLKDEFKIAVLSRGYKRKTSGFLLADNDSSTEEIGDEPRQMKQKFPDITVAVDGNRVRGINKLLEADKQLKIILLDDAYQHRYVTPGVSILLVDYNRPLKDDSMLPAGMLRESASEIRRADIIIVTKCPNKLKPIEQRLLEKDLKSFAYQKIYFTTLDYGQPKPVYKGFGKSITHDQMRDSKPTILFITGIANSRPFKTHIRGISTKIEEINYPDHYNYSAKDMHYIMEKFISIENSNKYIITTEKDAMRFQLFDDLDDEIKNVMYYIPIEVQFLEEESRNFNQQILNYVRNNKSDSILYKKQDKK